jgi:hypothetical protein
MLESLNLRFITGRLSMMNIVDEVLMELFRIFRYIEYEYSVVDSRKITDWLRGLYELLVKREWAARYFRYMPS